MKRRPRKSTDGAGNGGVFARLWRFLATLNRTVRKGLFAVLAMLPAA